GCRMNASLRSGSSSPPAPERGGRTVSGKNLRIAVVCGSLVAVTSGMARAQAQKPDPPPQWIETPSGRWMVHDEARPAPPVVTPGVCDQQTPAKPPSDAVVLFDGTDLSNWTDTKGEPSKWV